jgi:LuxR family maltose regulon positive regulatory protein
MVWFGLTVETWQEPGLPPSSPIRKHDPVGGRESSRVAVEASADAVDSFAPHLLQSRLRPPLPLLEVVQREELLRRLTVTRAPLVVISAPGGYGKTVTLTQWVEGDPRPFTWLQADEADNDPLLFLHYLTSALSKVAALDPLVVNWLQLAPPPVETRILPALAAAVQAAPEFVFVIDDAQLLQNELCWKMIGLLLEQLPPGAQLCLSGRTLPPLPLSRMRAAGRLLELGPRDLSLSRQETEELLHLHGMSVDDDGVARLHEVTEGWAAGLYLAALAGAEATDTRKLAAIHGMQHEIADYLAKEVLEQQSPEVAEFLLQTSILERLSPALCRAMTGDERSAEFLRDVARNSLFVSALDDDREWYRYHHLFAEFLQTELLRCSEAQVAVLHTRAAAWFEEHDQLEEAVRHWLAAGDASRAGEIVCRAHMHFTHLARYETLRRWLEMFSDEQILADPALTVAAGWIGPMAGDSKRGHGWIHAAFRAKVGDAVWPGAAVPVGAMQALLRAAFSQDVSQMRRDAELAVALGGEAHPAEHAAAAAVLGQARWLDGDTEGALPVLHEAQEEGAMANVLAQINALGIETLALTDEGRWSEARKLTAAGVQRSEEVGLGLGLPTFSFLVAQTRVEAHDGNPTWAERVATIDAIDAQGNVPTYLALLAEVLVGEMLLEHGDLPEATQWMHSAFASLTAMPNAGVLRPRLLRLRERLEERLLVEPMTPAERRILELLPTELTAGQIAERLWVSRETVKTHVRDIYGKLGVHSRGDAVARARELKLLQDA